MLQIGERIGPYEITSSLGTGGMGEVYRARDSRLGRDIALKVLPDDLAQDPNRVARFEREARTLASLSHPNIVTIHSVEQVGQRRLLTMELVEGATLDRHVRAGGVALDEFLDIAIPLADALIAAHERGIVHRDLKPMNVMIRPDGRPVVLDFGLARAGVEASAGAETAPALSTVGQVAGTPYYMSPEQAQGRAVDARSDLFSFGVIAYELLAGVRPFQGASIGDVIASVLRDAPVPLPARRKDVPDRLWRLIQRLLEKDVQRRGQSARDIKNELDEIRAERAAASTSAGKDAAGLRSMEVIAVLPLENLSRQPSEEFFADGMTEALITDLAKVGGLKVISRASVMRFKNAERSIQAIATALGVSAIVEGSVLRAGDRVRISARLVRVDTEEYLWAERYDRDLADVLALQDEVARAIAQAVDATLHGARPAAPRRVDPEAYLLDLRGRHLWHQRTEASFRAALEMFEDAVRRDPTYAPAYIGIAESLNMLANYGIVPPGDVWPRAAAATRRALELEESADAHRVLAFVHWQFEFAWEPAIAEYERALELDPNSPATTYWFGAYLGVIGRFRQARAMLDRAQQLDPLSLVVPSVQGWTRYFERRFEEAMPFFEHVLRIDPHFHLALWFRGEALAELGRFDEAIASLEEAYEVAGRTSRLLGYLGYACGRAGRIDRAKECLAELEARSSRGYVPPYFPALVLAGLDDADAALGRLEESYRIRDTMLRDLRADPQWDRFHAQPRFAALMEQLAFPAAD